MKFFFTLLILILSCSCQQKKNESSNNRISTPHSAEIKKDKQIGDTLFLDFKNQKNKSITEGFIDSLQTRIYIKFQNEYSSHLIGKIITPEEKANIRFNQIIFPDKTSDGPFGKDLNIDATQKGSYVLVVGPSQMAENPYWGKFQVQLESSKID
ncbi:hypothetical protein [Flavobacterium foetidum]|uniref:hypothetical protein n=1 Tax=Flavobacterium foetidum TaxID=2026681 RepID=UPI0010756B4D|nr:hypothetical protein [Flavobacterium foetidum]KAF2515698.1 hypothetical protein E0W73_08905 [Flavobacterium foetidum]